jgi:hypothetical protein
VTAGSYDYECCYEDYESPCRDPVDLSTWFARDQAYGFAVQPDP